MEAMTEVKLPEPKGLVIGDLVQGAHIAFAPPGIASTADATGSTAIYTADQMRAAILAERERCAKAVEAAGPKGPLKLVTEGFAAAIRKGP